MSRVVNNSEVKARRSAMKLSQKKLAARVELLSGKPFSQQALAKFENNPKADSAYTIYILAALDQFEREHRDASSTLAVQDASGYYELPRLMRREQEPDDSNIYDQLSEEDHVEAVKSIADKVSLAGAVELAEYFLARVKAGLQEQK